MVKIEWNEFSKDIDHLAELLRPSNFEGFLAVERGGLIPAAKLAYILGTRYIYTLRLDTEENRCLIPQRVIADYSDWLIVDDIVDSGYTVQFLRGIYKNAKIATVYAKRNSMRSVDFYSRIVSDDYQIFAWEEEEKV